MIVPEGSSLPRYSSHVHQILGVRVCHDCAPKPDFKVITKGRAKQVFLVTDTQLKTLPSYTVNLGKMLHGWYVHLMDGMG